MLECPTCDEAFYDRDDWHEHMDHEGHWLECETCPREFGTSHPRQHMNSADHWAQCYECDTCDREYMSQDAVNKHMAFGGHWKNYCKSCDRHFNNENNLQMHLNSRIHRGVCKQGYTGASGLSHHLETGSCPNAPQLDRDSILNIVRKRDQQGLITIKQLTWHESTGVTYSASGEAWTGSCWECYHCGRGYTTRQALDQHLKSPVYKETVYHCPNRGCDKEFKAIAALFNHPESASCKFMSYERVQKRIGSILTSNRMISF